MPNKRLDLFCNKGGVFVLLVTLFAYSATGQPANYISNGGFENSLPSSTLSLFNSVKFWGPIDTNKTGYYLYSLTLGNAPNCNTGFQSPRSGNNFILGQFYADYGGNYQRGYPRNRLKQTLKPNTVYCGKYFVVNTNNNRIAIDSYGMYAGNAATIDTIKQCMIPLTYLNPQIQNATGNIITDTLNWIPITGTFTANGDEKYLVLGNFKSNPATNTLLLNPTLTVMSNDVYIDDVSLIELDLPAFAGKDTSCIPGTTVYIGRTRDVGIDEACTWFKWPDMVTPLATGVAGLTVSPVQTTTYIVKQQLWCSGIKYDTVVVYKDGVGLSEFRFKSEDLRIYPVPASDVLIIETQRHGEFLTQRHKDTEALSYGFRVQVINSLGQIIREEEIKFLNNEAQIQTSDLTEGVYILLLKSGNSNTVSKRFVISR